MTGGLGREAPKLRRAALGLEGSAAHHARRERPTKNFAARQGGGRVRLFGRAIVTRMGRDSAGAAYGDKEARSSKAR